jgi:hypothetical protein
MPEGHRSKKLQIENCIIKKCVLLQNCVRSLVGQSTLVEGQNKVEVAAKKKANGLNRQKKQQIAHDEWRAGLSEAERVLARLKPLHETELHKMTEEQQLASR